MKIGYPCLNLSLECTSSRTFRLKNYSQKRLIKTVNDNLDCLFEIIKFNAANRIGFFRIGSNLIPFASHGICKVNWQALYKNNFRKIGEYIRSNRMRISMHPDQFVLLNSPTKKIVDNSLRELSYHAEVLDLLGLGLNCKIQIHVGGVYNNKKKSIEKFIRIFKTAPKTITRRLVIENDERLYSLKECLYIHSQTGIPVLFDNFHHSLNNNGEPLKKAINMAAKTWKNKDGLLMVDYSSQNKVKKLGAHAESLNTKKFENFLKETKPQDFDIMIEIKDKEKSALKAILIAFQDKRFTRD